VNVALEGLCSNKVMNKDFTLQVGFLLTLCFVGILSFTRAQNDQDVHVSLPEILSLELDDSSATSEAALDLDITVGLDITISLDITVSKDSYEITPATTTLRILANTAWQLSASYISSDPRVRLTWRVDNQAPQRLQSYSQILLQGGSTVTKTTTAKTITVAYGLAQPLPPEGHYQAVVTYTLTRP
jgi:hypothetical protein